MPHAVAGILARTQAAAYMVPLLLKRWIKAQSMRGPTLTANMGILQTSRIRLSTSGLVLPKGRVCALLRQLGARQTGQTRGKL